MSIAIYVLGAAALAAFAFLIYRLVLGSKFLLRYRGERLVVCPETHKAAAVAVAAGKGAAELAAGTPRLRLRECSRWPEREGCGQDCLSQIQADPQSCLVWNVVNAWYFGKNCVICKKAFGKINWHDHPPALVDSEGRTVQWNQVSPEKLPDYFASHWPVCWDCHVAESFRREHPELVTDRLVH